MSYSLPSLTVNEVLPQIDHAIEDQRVLWIDLRSRRSEPSSYAPLRERCALHRLATTDANGSSCAIDPDAIDRAVSLYRPVLLCFECDPLDDVCALAVEYARHRYPDLSVLRLSDPTASLADARQGSVRRRRLRTHEAASYAKANLDRYVSLQDAATRCHMSKYEFSRAFKREHGLSFVEFILQLRVRRAAELLEQHDLAVKEVAFAVGFNDVSYFGRMFRRYFGIAPSRYQCRSPFEASAAFGPQSPLAEARPGTAVHV